MTSCMAMELGLKKTKNAQTSTTLVPRSDGNTRPKDPRDSCFSSSAEGKENMESGKQTHGWLAKVCNKLRNRQRRHEKCEKCGQKSDTCRANASFISGRKHYLCEGCRVSSDNMKNMYQQLCRNLSLRDPPRTVCNSGGLTPPTSTRSGGVVRSRSMRTRPVAPESGYNTATSLDSSCSNGRLSPDSVCASSAGCNGCIPLPDCCPHRCGEWESSEASSTKENHIFSKDRSEVFGGAFKSEKAHFQTGPQTKIYTRQPPPPYRLKQGVQPPPTHQKSRLDKDTNKYDGYLEIRTPNSQSVKYVFRQRAACREGALDNDEVQSDHLARRRYSENLKLCYRCNKYRCIAFRAPFGNGWLCEDCTDDLM